MRISRMSEKSSVPQWAIEGSDLAALEQNEQLLQTSVDRINATEASKVSEVDIVDECDYIEKCASSNQTYFYNTTWKSNHQDHLKEYASVCGLKGNRVVGVDPTTLVQKQIEASSEQMVKTASVQDVALKESLSDALGDPFHIAERVDTSHMDKADWEQIGRQSDMPEFSTTAAMKGAILPLRGGEDYRKANSPSLPKNQNSILDPKALDRMYASEDEDTGQRLRRERQDRETAITDGHKAWEQSHVDAMTSNDDINIPQGVVFPTEVMNAQSGITGEMGVHGKFDPDSIPDKTAGEALAEQNETRKAGIQREEETDRSWDELKAAPTRMISDNFTDELKKYMK